MGDSKHDEEAGAAVAVLALIAVAALIVLFALPVIAVGTGFGVLACRVIPDDLRYRLGITTDEEQAKKSFLWTASATGLFLCLHLVYFAFGSDGDFSSRFQYSVVGLYVHAVQPYYEMLGSLLLKILSTIVEAIVWLCKELYLLAGGTKG